MVIVVAEGAGQNLLAEAAEWDASGTVAMAISARFLRDEIPEAFRAQGISVSLRYIDPSYMIRSLPRQRSRRQLLPSIGSCGRSRRHGGQDRHCHRFAGDGG